VTGKENSGRIGDKNNSFFKQEKSKGKPLFVKGSNIVKVEEGKPRGSSKGKEIHTSRPVSAKKGKAKNKGNA
jgi:hypothetical protein